jgi:DNA polymerase-3 subunit delta
MRIYPNQLESLLAQSIAPCYLLFGEETFLLNNTAKQIKAKARKEGFDEIIRFSATAQFDWQTLMQEYASLSLFSSRKIIEIELGDSKPNAAGGKLLKTLSETTNPDCIVIFKGEKVGNDIQRTAWFKALDKIGVFVPCYPMQGKQLSSWLDQQCREHQLALTSDAKALLIEYNQSNLFAISQELEKLSLLSLPDKIDVETLAPSLINQSRLDVFDLADALLQGHAKKLVIFYINLNKKAVSLLLFYGH